MRSDKVVPAAPETTPQMSPATSLQTLDTLAAFLISHRACLAPGSFLAAMATKGGWSALATAMPMMSVMMPIATSSSTVRVATAMPAPARAAEEDQLMSMDRPKDRKNTISTQLAAFFFPFFFCEAIFSLPCISNSAGRGGFARSKQTASPRCPAKRR